MTGHPEAALAREIALCYTSLALVTDLDAGLELGEGVTHAEVLAAFGKNLERLRDLLLRVAQRLPKGPCSCHDVLAGVDTGIPLP
jgi:5'-methylthioadenosine phosphorylase